MGGCSLRFPKLLSLQADVSHMKPERPHTAKILLCIMVSASAITHGDNKFKRTHGRKGLAFRRSSYWQPKQISKCLRMI